MPVTLHQPVAGMDRGETYSGPLEPWLIANGYASTGDNVDKVNLRGAKPEDDPQLAENREDPVDVRADSLLPGAPSLDRELKYGGLAEGLEAEAEPVEDGSREPDPLPGTRGFVVGAETDPAVTEARKELDGSRSGQDVEPLETPEPPAARNLTVGTDDGVQANVLPEPDPRAAEETKPKVRRTRKAPARKETDHALTEPRDEQPGEQHGVEDALTDK